MTHSLSSEALAFLEQAPNVTVAQIRHGRAVPADPGLYGWWFDSALLPDVTDVLTRGSFRLLYVGIAPSAAPKEGVKPRTLRERLGNHCRGPIATSTLRRTLVSLLQHDDSFRVDKGPNGKWRIWPQGEVMLTDWMDAHARVSWLANDAPWLMEDELIKHGPRLPLNIRGSQDPFAAELKKLRAKAWDDATDSSRFVGEPSGIKMYGKVKRVVTEVHEDEAD